jgi:hypothetical protein
MGDPMDGWPPITEPLLRERQAMSDAAFLAFLGEILAALPARELTDEHYATAIGYPWERPPGSCLVTDGHVEDVDDPALVARYLGDPERVPLLAYGANASPGRLALKLAHLPDEHRSALVLAAELEGFDVGAAAQGPVFSSMPGTLIPSPGTAVRVALLFLTPVQFTTLWWTELSYRVGALEDVVVCSPLADEPISRVIAFVSRFGAFCVDGEPVAMAAIPARERRARALSQHELLEAAARLALHDGATARDLLRCAYAAPAAFLAERYPALRAVARPFASPHWRAMPAT